MQLAGVVIRVIALFRLIPFSEAQIPWRAVGLAAAAFAFPLLQLISVPFSLWSEIPGRQFAVASFDAAGLHPSRMPITLACGTTRLRSGDLPAFALFLATLYIAKRKTGAGLWLLCWEWRLATSRWDLPRFRRDRRVCCILSKTPISNQPLACLPTASLSPPCRRPACPLHCMDNLAGVLYHSHRGMPLRIFHYGICLLPCCCRFAGRNYPGNACHAQCGFACLGSIHLHMILWPPKRSFMGALSA